MVGNACQDKKTIVDLAVGRDHNCIVLNDGSVRCWGYNGDTSADSGYKDGGTTTHNITDMAAVDLGGKEALEVEAGWRHACAILKDKSVMCWGRNDEGQTTNPQSGDQGAVAVDLGTDGQGHHLKALALSLGKKHSCALVDEGDGDSLGLVKCWGDNTYQQKDGDINNPSDTDMVTVNLGSVSTGSTIQCRDPLWDLVKGSLDKTKLVWSQPGSVSTKAKALASGDKHTCAILSDDSVKCWGDNSAGQTWGGTPTLLNVAPLTIAAGKNHTCITKDIATHAVRCWGENDNSEVLGSGNTDASRIANVHLGAGKKAKKVALGDDHTCAILSDDTVKCWGSNAHLQSNPDGGTSDTRVAAVNLGTSRTAVILGAGRQHTCAVLDNNEVKCWGASDNQRIASPGSVQICPLGMVSNPTEGLCRAPQTNKYADSRGLEQDCDTSQPPIAHSGSLGGQVESLVTASTCPYTCHDGFWKKLNDRTCVSSCPAGYVRETITKECLVPSLGKYADAHGVEQSCTGIIADSHSIGGQAVSVLTDTACPYTCVVGFRQKTHSDGTRSCDKLPKGTYLGANRMEKRCHSVPAHGYYIAVQPKRVASADACEFKCDIGHVQEGTTVDNGRCFALSKGKFFSDRVAARKGKLEVCVVLKNGSKQCWGERSCDPPPANGGWVRTQPLSVKKPSDCKFGCKRGYAKVGNNVGFGVCALPKPQKGEYVSAGGVMMACNNAPPNGDHIAVQPERVTSAGACEFECDFGYMKSGFSVSSSAAGCWPVAKGKFFKNATDRKKGRDSSCNRPPAHGDWVRTQLLSVKRNSDCDFKCNWGYVKIGTKVGSRFPDAECRRLPMAQAVALGASTSCALSDGDVKCWGNSRLVSPVDLGTAQDGSTKLKAQALVKGSGYACVILKNGNLDHGSVKCWGRNGHGQLGLGHTNNERLPAGLATVDLGTDTSSNPYTAKALAAGSDHTCAILNDDSVKCWGNNGDRQLGVGDNQVDVYHSPQAVSLGTDTSSSNPYTAKALSAGGASTCAILNDDSVKCWGIIESVRQTNYGTPQAVSLGTDTSSSPSTPTLPRPFPWRVPASVSF